MKKAVGILLLVLFATGSILPLYGATQTTIVLTVGSPVTTVNGSSVTLDVAPFIKDSRTFVPLRFVSEQLGANVTYTTKPDGSVEKVYVTMGESSTPTQGKSLTVEGVTLAVVNIDRTKSLGSGAKEGYCFLNLELYFENNSSSRFSVNPFYASSRMEWGIRIIHPFSPKSLS